jgi:hypothetical protein
MRILNALATVMVLTLWSFSALATPTYAITESGDMPDVWTLFVNGENTRFRRHIAALL